MPRVSTTKQRNAQRLRYYRKHAANKANRFRRWTTYEKQMIMLSTFGDVALSTELGRSVEAIQMKRSKMRKAG